VFNALVPHIKRHQGKLYPLHVGDTWFEAPPAAREAARDGDPLRGHTYPPPEGLPELVEAIIRRVSRRHGVTLEREALLVTAGATGALNAMVQALSDPGDEVILPSPYWPLIRGILLSRGVRPVEVPVFTRLGEPGFDLEAALEAAVTPRTTAIYLNTPNNPTGVVLGPAELDAIARVAGRHDLWVLCDEVYEDLSFGDTPSAAWRHPGLAGRAVVAHSLSKAYAMAGARVGYLHGTPEGVQMVRGVHTYQVYSAARPMQRLAARALDESDGWLEGFRGEIAAMAARAARALGQPVPKAGTFLFLDLGRWCSPGDPDCLPLLIRCVEAGVVLVPGVSCGAGFERWARICYTAVPPADLEEALAALTGVLGVG
jgi:N-succinyldiaminopimelate aminotransferase